MVWLSGGVWSKFGITCTRVADPDPRILVGSMSESERPNPKWTFFLSIFLKNLYLKKGFKSGLTQFLLSVVFRIWFIFGSNVPILSLGSDPVAGNLHPDPHPSECLFRIYTALSGVVVILGFIAPVRIFQSRHSCVQYKSHWILFWSVVLSCYWLTP